MIRQVKSATEKRSFKARTFRPRLGDRIAFHGVVYVLSPEADGVPFVMEKDVDPFYSPENQERLRRSIEDANAGRLTEHDLIRV